MVKGVERRGGARVRAGGFARMMQISFASTGRLQGLESNQEHRALRHMRGIRNCNIREQNSER